MLKVGVIGLGVGEAHAYNFAADERCEVIALCDFDSEKMDKVAGKIPDAALFTDADKLLDLDLDIAVVAGFDDSHHAQIMKALGRGMHIFAEKPMCLFEKEAIEIRKKVAETGKFISSNLCLRTAPLFTSAREAVQSGKMGDIFHMEGDYLWGRLHKLDGGWRSKMDFYSITYGAAVHMIDLLMWIYGKKPVEVFAYGNNIGGRAVKFPFDDFSVALLKFEDGVTAKVTANGGCAHPHFHKVEIMGTDATFSHTPLGSKWTQSRDYNDTPRDAGDGYPAREERWKVISTFVDSITNNKEMSLISGNDVFDTMSVCFAVERSLQSGKAETVKYL
ncbi:Gfo/Idh/MocA family protein [Desulfovibrio sp. JC010]|uniref:Gfo/Idh/MocA family protein n=1 Tax=Desulfovibrio sp. JC010 TaxID=2593641 RepID=UPI0013D33766|nr:Gfo/Idh/MocA family oxidoreductase [Desulfovibrio sp. JC010]NDV27159.1 Gfo/Idh/MocA family oxidoreductase [Desulfovibrio sp. JC010]